MEVYKFGGASVKDAEGIRTVAKIIRLRRPDLLVISAMGKTTNALEQVVSKHYHGDQESLALLEAIKESHKSVACQLGVDDLLDQGIFDEIFTEAEWILEAKVQDQFDYLYDQIVVIGELLSSRLVWAYLHRSGLACQWLDARDLIKTNDRFRDAQVDWELSSQRVKQWMEPIIRQGVTVITAGFIGSTSDNDSITLGREGSDYSAAIFTHILGAKNLTVWKDVPGIMTADPDVDMQAELLPRLDYQEALEMTFYGAKVIHPKTLHPLMTRDIPLLVRSFQDPQASGSIVALFPDLKYPPITIVLPGQSFLEFRTKDFSFVLEDHFSRIFQEAVKHKIKVRLIENLALSLFLVVEADPEHLSEFCMRLSEEFILVQGVLADLWTVRHAGRDASFAWKEDKKILLETYFGDTLQIVLAI